MLWKFCNVERRVRRQIQRLRWLRLRFTDVRRNDATKQHVHVSIESINSEDSLRLWGYKELGGMPYLDYGTIWRQLVYYVMSD